MNNVNVSLSTVRLFHKLFPCDAIATIHSFFLGTKSEDRTMMFPDDSVGILYVGPCSHKEVKRSQQDCHSPRSECDLSRFESSA